MSSKSAANGSSSDLKQALLASQGGTSPVSDGGHGSRPHARSVVEMQAGVGAGAGAGATASTTAAAAGAGAAKTTPHCHKPATTATSGRGGGGGGGGGHRSRGKGGTTGVPKVLRERVVSEFSLESRRRWDTTRFRVGRFTKMVFYHAFYPFTVPIAMCVEGTTAAASMDFLPRSMGGFLSQGVLTSVLMTCTITTIAGVQDCPTIGLPLLILAWMLHTNLIIVRSATYAMMNDEDWEAMHSTGLSSCQRQTNFLYDWLNPSPDAIYRQLQVSAMETRTDTHAGRFTFTFESDATSTLSELFNDQAATKHMKQATRQRLLMGDGVLPAPVVAICSIMRANQAATRGMSSAKAMHMQGAFIFLVGVIAVGVGAIRQEIVNSGVQHWGRTVVCAACVLGLALVYLHFSAATFVLLRVGIVDFARRAKTQDSLLNLITLREQVRESEDKLPIVLKLPPLIRLSQPNNIRTYLSLRLLLKRFGSSMMTRSQVLTAMILIEYAVFTAALVIQEVAGLSIINESFVVLVTYNLLMYGFFVGRMIMNGGEANSIGAQSITMLRSLQLRVRERVAYLAVPDVRERHHSMVAKANACCPEDMVDLEQAADATNEAFTGSDVAVLRAADRLLDAAISTVEREEKEQPVTFLGLTAGSTMLRSVGTVGSAAVLAGLKSAIPALERGIAELREHQQG